jgi:Carboxypeptidase regulatory-like domain
MRLVLITISFCSAVTFGQSDRGIISGTVYDRIGHEIVSAPVEATSAGTGAKYTTTSGDGGDYSLSLPAGKYDLSVEVLGHRYLQQGILVTPDRPLKIDVTLAIP